MIALELLGFLLVGQALYVASTLAAVRVFGARAEAASIGFGPKLFRVALWRDVFAAPDGAELRDVTLTVALIPLVSWVKIEGMAATERVGFRALHPLRRVGVVLGAWCLPALVAALLLGPARAAHHVATLVPNLATALRGAGRARLLEPFEALAWPAALGVFLAKFTAFNLLPFPNVAGGHALRHLVAWVAPSTDDGKPAAWSSALGLALILAWVTFATVR
jgi:membrane-associated protease RseP (regulator of RpoE activity)